MIRTGTLQPQHRQNKANTDGRHQNTTELLGQQHQSHSTAGGEKNDIDMICITGAQSKTTKKNTVVFSTVRYGEYPPLNGVYTSAPNLSNYS